MRKVGIEMKRTAIACMIGLALLGAACGQTTENTSVAASPGEPPTVGAEAPTTSGDANVGVADPAELVDDIELQLEASNVEAWEIPGATDVLASRGTIDGQLWVWTSSEAESQLNLLDTKGNVETIRLGKTVDLGFEFNLLNGMAIDHSSGRVWVGTRTTLAWVDPGSSEVWTLDIEGIVKPDPALDVLRPPALAGATSIADIAITPLGEVAVAVMGASELLLVAPDGRPRTIDLASSEATALAVHDGAVWAGLTSAVSGQPDSVARVELDGTDIVTVEAVANSQALTVMGDTILSGIDPNSLTRMGGTEGVVGLRRSSTALVVPWLAESDHGVTVARIPGGVEIWTSADVEPTTLSVGTTTDCPTAKDFSSPLMSVDEERIPKECPLSAVWAVPDGEGGVWALPDHGSRTIVRIQP